MVAGYRSSQVLASVGKRATVIHNNQWAVTNSLYSLWLCWRWLTGPMIVINCDVLMHPEILARLLCTGGNAFAYDSSSGDQDEHMKVHLADGCLVAMRKDLPNWDGENVGILYFDRRATVELWSTAETVLRERGVSHWAATAVEELGHLVPLRAVDVCDLPWIEIDFAGDLDQARRFTWPAICGRRDEPRVGDGGLGQQRFQRYALLRRKLPHLHTLRA